MDLSVADNNYLFSPSKWQTYFCPLWALLSTVAMSYESDTVGKVKSGVGQGSRAEAEARPGIVT